MPADVYQLVVGGRDGDIGHLHVVVIDIDPEQRLCIPAYDAEKPAVNALVSELHRNGIFEGVGWVEIDNRIEMTFDGQWTGKVAKWVAYSLRRVEQRRLDRRVGTMSDVGLARIVECLLNLHVNRPGSTLTDDEFRKVKRLARRLGVNVPPTI